MGTGVIFHTLEFSVMGLEHSFLNSYFAIGELSGAKLSDAKLAAAVRFSTPSFG